MKYVKLILQITCLYGIYSIGEGIRALIKLPIPGSLIGMVLLFLAFHFKLIKRNWFSSGGSFLLKNLPILFIPATVGIIDYLNIFKGFGIITLFIAFSSTMIVMVASAYISDVLLAKGKKVHKEKELSL
ncbi:MULTISPECIES: CidA/LrgA family protein [Bacillaceae]|uniref:CidA/LrgA family protein n=1 Tax=Metabacillus endolithicus TaxID=1535204 RepID=A0ABW5BTY3_9BACI|nr:MULTISPECIES: CidA/LrgA family protein [Bacillaceae]PGT91160.1 CidA/LrgA family protein [Bacillus sp. AFS040349]UGB29857.1 CidA/LrgA family protein [Metabacillus sp. B2-18]UPG64862.1 CidA/LrgA family protein [Metabacillus endolithicus]